MKQNIAKLNENDLHYMVRKCIGNVLKEYTQRKQAASKSDTIVRLTESDLKKIVKRMSLNEDDSIETLDDKMRADAFCDHGFSVEGSVRVFFDADTLEILPGKTDNSISVYLSSNDYEVLEYDYEPDTYDYPGYFDYSVRCNDITEYEMRDFPRKYRDNPEAADELVEQFVEKHRDELLTKLSDKKNIDEIEKY